MYAIASLLNPEPAQRVETLWARFETRCGLIGIKTAPLAHFTWVAAEAYEAEPVQRVLTELASQVQPFRVHTAGLGVFTGSLPVVYISLVKDEKLLALHKLLWERTLPYAITPNLHYDPSSWIPHVTLALHESDAAQLGCAIAEIAFQPIDFEIVVDHFAMLYQFDGHSGAQGRFDFGGFPPRY